MQQHFDDAVIRKKLCLHENARKTLIHENDVVRMLSLVWRGKFTFPEGERRR